MTQREFYTNIINGVVGDNEVAHATEELEKMNARNAARKDKPSKAQIENAPIAEAVVAYLGEHGQTLSTELAKAVGQSTSKITGVAGTLVKAGTLVAVKVKVPKIGERTAYKLA